MVPVAPITRTAPGFVAVLAAWGVGEGVDAATGVLPGPVAGLLVLAAVLLARPAAVEVVAPAAELAIRALPVLFVPAVVAAAGVEGDVDVVALVLGVAVSVPVGFVVAARLAR